MKSVLITGANKGLGFATAQYLLENNYYVYLACRNENRGAEAARKLKTAGLEHCQSIVMDTTSEASVGKARDFLLTQISSLDALINNAGILGKIATAENPMTTADIQHVFDTNFFGAIRVTQAFLPLLQESPSPRIVNVTSDLASLSLHNDPTWKFYPFKGLAYGPSKSALNAYTVALAFHLRDKGFKINCVTPGHTATEFNNYRGQKDPKESCKVIARYAMLDQDGPTGGFFDEEGTLGW